MSADDDEGYFYYYVELKPHLVFRHWGRIIKTSRPSWGSTTWPGQFAELKHRAL